jgi:predicted O-methyltransferase YrrM
LLKKILNKIIKNFNFLKVVNLNKKIYTHLSIKDSINLITLAQKSKNILEIGSYLGYSANLFLLSGKKINKLYCVDTFLNDAMSEGKRDTFEIFKKNTKKFSSKIEIFRGLSDHQIKNLYFLNKKIDLIFIDGDHSYEQVLKDWNNYKILLKQDGIIALHDYGWSKDVQSVVKNFILKETYNHQCEDNLWWAYKL